jgi:hypothetical protein
MLAFFPCATVSVALFRSRSFAVSSSFTRRFFAVALLPFACLDDRQPELVERKTFQPSRLALRVEGPEYGVGR